jgi:hypothetical protein
VVVTLVQDGEGVRVVVADDGCGMSAPDLHGLYRAGHFGLVGVSERMARVGGSAQVDSRPGAGTTVALCVTSRKGTAEDGIERLNGVVPVRVVGLPPDPVVLNLVQEPRCGGRIGRDRRVRG